MTAANVKRRLSAAARNRRRVVSVIGSGRTSDPHCDEVGRLIAMLGYDLLTGAGRGVMEAVSRAFFETSPRAGIVIGIVPAEVHGLASLEQRVTVDPLYEPPRGYPNVWVELALYTHLPDSGAKGTLRSSRNHINVLSADALVVLPGREGTDSEVWLARQYGVPAIAFGTHPHGAPHGIPHAETLDELRAFLQRHVG